MRLETFLHDSQGWSARPLPDLDSERTLVVVFGAPGHLDTPGPLEELRAAYPLSHLVGCSTAGEIHDGLLMDDSLSVAVVQFEHSSVRSAAVSIEGAEHSHAAGEELARQLAGDDLRAVFVVSDGLEVNGTQLVRGLGSRLPASVIVTGGLAGDGDRFERTWVLDGGRPTPGRIAAVGLYGERLCIGHGSRGGWDKFGPSRRVTRSSGNVLHELDGRPALGLYKEYLGDRVRDLPASALLFPLAISSSPEDPRVLVRTVLAVHEEDESMTFAGDLPEGSTAQLMLANFERLIDGASGAAGDARVVGSTCPDLGPILSIAISCVGRRLILGERTEEEIEGALGALPKGTRQVGFYSYGEISPTGLGSCELHNQTMTLTTIAER